MDNKTGGCAIYLDGDNNGNIPPSSGLQLPMILGGKHLNNAISDPQELLFLLEENGEEYDTIGQHISNLYTH